MREDEEALKALQVRKETLVNLDHQVRLARGVLKAQMEPEVFQDRKVLPEITEKTGHQVLLAKGDHQAKRALKDQLEHLVWLDRLDLPVNLDQLANQEVQVFFSFLAKTIKS